MYKFAVKKAWLMAITKKARLATTRYDSPRLATTRHDSPRLATTRHDSPRLATTRHDSPRLATTLIHQTAEKNILDDRDTTTCKWQMSLVCRGGNVLTKLIVYRPLYTGPCIQALIVYRLIVYRPWPQL